MCERYVYFFDTLKRCPEIHPSLSPCPLIEVDSVLPVTSNTLVQAASDRKLSLSFYIAMYCSHISLVDMGDRYVQVGVYVMTCISNGGRSCGGRLLRSGVVEVWSWASLGLWERLNFLTAIRSNNLRGSPIYYTDFKPWTIDPPRAPKLLVCALPPFRLCAPFTHWW